MYNINKLWHEHKMAQDNRNSSVFFKTLQDKPNFLVSPALNIFGVFHTACKVSITSNKGLYLAPYKYKYINISIYDNQSEDI